jgi:carboxymethylenebutenolidase
MCYSDDASPPPPPVQQPIGEHGRLELTSADGTRFGAYHAHPGSPSTIGMVILPDVRGLHPFYEQLAQRCAEAGMHAVAIDYFGRTAGIGGRGEDFPFREHVEKMEPPRTAEDVGAAVAWLRGTADVGPIFTVGFCMGGALSWAQSAAGHRLNGCIGFYGVPSRVADRIPDMVAPLLVLAAGQDFTPVAEVERFVDQVRAAGLAAELHVYPDAPHSFFDRAFAEHRAACADSWARILDFVNRNSDAPVHT